MVNRDICNGGDDTPHADGASKKGVTIEDNGEPVQHRGDRDIDIAALREAVRFLLQGLSKLADQRAHDEKELNEQITRLANKVEKLAERLASVGDELKQKEELFKERYDLLEQHNHNEERIAYSVLVNPQQMDGPPKPADSPVTSVGRGTDHTANTEPRMVFLERMQEYPAGQPATTDRMSEGISPPFGLAEERKESGGPTDEVSLLLPAWTDAADKTHRETLGELKISLEDIARRIKNVDGDMASTPGVLSHDIQPCRSELPAGRDQNSSDSDEREPNPTSFDASRSSVNAILDVPSLSIAEVRRAMRAAAEPERTRWVNYPTGLLDAEEQTDRLKSPRESRLQGERKFQPAARVVVAALILLVLIAAMMLVKIDIGNFLL